MQNFIFKYSNSQIFRFRSLRIVEISNFAIVQLYMLRLRVSHTLTNHTSVTIITITLFKMYLFYQINQFENTLNKF